MISLGTANAMLFISVSISDYLLHKHQRILNNHYYYNIFSYSFSVYDDDIELFLWRGEHLRVKIQLTCWQSQQLGHH